jgi:hypothetical protein
MHPHHHALSSAKKHGGKPEDYEFIHAWFDATKAFMGDARHRALRHHAAGIFWCEQEFGSIIRNSDGKDIPVRLIAEQHVTEDMGFIPTVEWWLSRIPLAYDMNPVLKRTTSPLNTDEIKRAMIKSMYEQNEEGR